jgi:hypothetical protein
LPIEGKTVKCFLGKHDCFGKLILSAQTYGLFLKLSESEQRKVKLGNLLYVEPDEISDLLQKTKYLVATQGVSVPDKLGDVINLASTGLVMELGGYDPPPMIHHGVPVWDKPLTIKFEPNVDKIPVRAGLSVEAGLKTRLTTACPAAFVQLSQLVSNRLRDHFSHDPFVRVGFEESDKLWEVLKAYDKRFALQQL